MGCISGFRIRRLPGPEYEWGLKLSQRGAEEQAQPSASNLRLHSSNESVPTGRYCFSIFLFAGYIRDRE